MYVILLTPDIRFNDTFAMLSTRESEKVAQSLPFLTRSPKVVVYGHDKLLYGVQTFRVSRHVFCHFT